MWRAIKQAGRLYCVGGQGRRFCFRGVAFAPEGSEGEGTTQPGRLGKVVPTDVRRCVGGAEEAGAPGAEWSREGGREAGRRWRAGSREEGPGASCSPGEIWAFEQRGSPVRGYSEPFFRTVFEEILKSEPQPSSDCDRRWLLVQCMTARQLQMPVV